MFCKCLFRSYMKMLHLNDHKPVVSLLFLPTKSEHITRHTKVGVMDTRNMKSGGRTNYQHSNQESRRWARAQARTIRWSGKRDSDMRRLHTNWRFKKQQTRIIKTESFADTSWKDTWSQDAHVWKKKNLDMRQASMRGNGRGMQSLIPTGKTFRLDLSFSLRIRGFDKTFNQNQNQFSLGVIFTSSTFLFSFAPYLAFLSP